MEEKNIAQNVQDKTNDIDKINFGNIMEKINDLIRIHNISETILGTIEDVKKFSIDALQSIANECASDIKNLRKNNLFNNNITCYQEV
jgi:hypothetical protein